MFLEGWLNNLWYSHKQYEVIKMMIQISIWQTIAYGPDHPCSFIYMLSKAARMLLNKGRVEQLQQGPYGSQSLKYFLLALYSKHFPTWIQIITCRMTIFSEKDTFLLCLLLQICIYIFFFQVLKISEVEFIYSIILVSCVQHSDLVFLQIILHLKLLQSNDYSSPYCTLYPCCLFILYIVVCIP